MNVMINILRYMVAVHRKRIGACRGGYGKYKVITVFEGYERGCDGRVKEVE